jgi:hypothetical protein
MFEIILDKFFGPKNYLPPFYFSPKLNLELTQIDLEFLTNLFLQSATKVPSLTREDRIWFLEEIATCQRILYPEMSHEERINLLQKTVVEFERKAKK